MYSVYRIVYVSIGTRISVHMLPSIVYEDFSYYHCVIVFLGDKCPLRTKDSIIASHMSRPVV